jgi:hypothetical protein
MEIKREKYKIFTEASYQKMKDLFSKFSASGEKFSIPSRGVST